MFINSFVKTKRKLAVPLVLIAVICIFSVYTSRYFDGTGWLGPVTEYWASQGVAVEPSDFTVTTSMKDTLEFAKAAEKVDLQPYRFFVFPLMPSQTQFFRYNLPLISGDLIGSTDSEKLYAEYIHKLNELILSGDNRTAISLSALRGKYIAVIDDLKSAGYKGIPYKWGGLRGALAGDPQIFEQIISKMEGLERSPEKNNIFVNTYDPLPLLSYVENAILVEGNLNDLFNLYNYVTPKNGSTIIPIFADQISQKEIQLFTIF